MSRRAILLLVIGLLFAQVPGVQADGESWDARLVGLRSVYGDEGWKYGQSTDPGLSASALLAHARNQTVSYRSALGLRLEVDLELYYTGDGTAPTCGTATGNLYGVTARIPTAKGPVDAYVPPSADCRRFTLLFDLDGSNHADVQGRSPPALAPGVHTIEVSIFKRINANPPTQRVGDAAFRFSYVIPYQQVDAPGIAHRPHQQDVPDSIFRLYTDIGSDRSVRMITRTLNASSTWHVEYDFGPAAAGQGVVLHAFLARSQVAGSPAPAPSAPSVPVLGDNRTGTGLAENTNRFVTIDGFEVTRGTVDEEGRASFTVSGRALLRNDNAGMFVLAATLESNFRVSDCPGDCKGGDGFMVGATELVLPIVREPGPAPSIHGFAVSRPSGGATGPVGEALEAANSIQVFVQDPTFDPASSRTSGDVWALVPDLRSNAPLASASMVPSQRESNLFVAELAVQNIHAQRVSHYRVVGLLYQNDVFKGLAQADRGYGLSVEAPVAVVPPGAGGVYLNFTSRTTDHDGGMPESGYDIDVLYRVMVAGKGTVSGTVSMREGGNRSVFVPVESGQAGFVAVTINSTSGDVRPRTRETGVDFVVSPDERNLADRIPGFEAFALLAAVLVWVARRPR